MTKKEIVVLTGVTIFLIIIIYALYQYGSLGNVRQKQPEIISPLPKNEKPIPVHIDEREQKLYNFLYNYKSNLDNYAKDFIQIADTYKLDYRLLPAIAGVESTFGRNTPFANPYNAFGWGCSSSTTCKSFGSYRDAMDRVAFGISTARAYRTYRATGKITDLAYTYNGVSPEQWSQKVTFFMEEIK